MNLDFGCTRLILAKCNAEGLLRNQAAYVLATAWHETGHTMHPVREMGGETYLRSKAYYPYVGMGFVQLTWKRNYELASKKLGVDFVANPRLLLDPEHAAVILVTGMRDGWFTGKKLADYITLQESNFAGARRIINGTDRAALIAGHAVQYDAALKAVGYGG
ncbi:carboxypeptidase [Mesorhizobium sp. ESP-6-2]|uniref:carboxypeptidase n=1 Tax=Mesorhizobium sp. ESP-6-2 TaxID=2876625 RepID=UPI001CCD9C88|nr:carboxypeptidase [Mesorhizobium sp. ESP-6-2]MBZ9808112.1 carboxypeptidase [Mesorhizobium sp. ESP-6-2]